MWKCIWNTPDYVENMDALCILSILFRLVYILVVILEMKRSYKL